MRKRSLIEWDDHRDRDLLLQLTQFKARARGRRLKELALLGLLAERAGCRAVVDKDGASRLEGVAVPVFSATAAATSVVHAPGRFEPPPPVAPPTRSAEHEAGLSALLGNVVGF